MGGRCLRHGLKTAMLCVIDVILMRNYGTTHCLDRAPLVGTRAIGVVETAHGRRV